MLRSSCGQNHQDQDQNQNQNQIRSNAQDSSRSSVCLQYYKCFCCFKSTIVQDGPKRRREMASKWAQVQLRGASLGPKRAGRWAASRRQEHKPNTVSCLRGARAHQLDCLGGRLVSRLLARCWPQWISIFICIFVQTFVAHSQTGGNKETISALYFFPPSFSSILWPSSATWPTVFAADCLWSISWNKSGQVGRAFTGFHWPNGKKISVFLGVVELWWTFGSIWRRRQVRSGRPVGGAV